MEITTQCLNINWIQHYQWFSVELFVHYSDEWCVCVLMVSQCFGEYGNLILWTERRYLVLLVESLG